jgi:PPOX class probable F420-dependent enzyme
MTNTKGGWVTGTDDRRPSIGGLEIRRPNELDAAVSDLLRATNVCVVSTLGEDGVIHARTVWVDTDGEHVILNSVGRRVWVQDVERRRRATCTVVNASNPYEFVSIEGTVVACSHDGADEHIDSLALKYLGVGRYPFHSASEPRVRIVLHPDRILYVAPEDAALG